METRFEKTTKGRPLLIFNNERYTHYYTNNIKISRWRCVRYGNGCRAQLQTFNGKVVGNKSPVHIHRNARGFVSSRPAVLNASRRDERNKKIATLRKLLGFQKPEDLTNESSGEENQSDKSTSSSEEEEIENLPPKHTKRNVKWLEW
jgi:hypothetical protein